MGPLYPWVLDPARSPETIPENATGPRVAPRACLVSEARSEAEPDARGQDVDVLGLARTLRRVGDRIEGRTRPHVTASGVEGEPRSEPPGQTGEDLGSDVVALVVRVLACEERNEASAGQRDGVLLNRVLGPVPVRTSVHAEGRRPRIRGPSADLDTPILVPADRVAGIGGGSSAFEHGVQVVDTQCRELTAPVGEVA